MRRHIWWLALILILTSLAWAGLPFQPNEAFPDLKLKRPLNQAQAAYLGVPAGEGSFKISQIKANLVLVEIFSMYCPHCQAEAPRVNGLFKLINRGPHQKKLKMLGIGVGNSDYEVGVFRDKYTVSFPLFSDRDFTIHKVTRKPRTPYFLLLRLGKKGPQVVFSHLGPIKDPQTFLKLLLSKDSLI